jgi:hypothetical protein
MSVVIASVVVASVLTCISVVAVVASIVVVGASACGGILRNKAELTYYYPNLNCYYSSANRNETLFKAR